MAPKIILLTASVEEDTREVIHAADTALVFAAEIGPLGLVSMIP